MRWALPILLWTFHVRMPITSPYAKTTPRPTFYKGGHVPLTALCSLLSAHEPVLVFRISNL